MMRRRLSTVLLLAGSGLLLWCASVWAGATLFERLEYRRWNTAPLQTSRAPAPSPPRPRKPKPHDVVAWLDIPSLGISTAVLEGDDALSLRYGAGHIPSTPLPGQGGNVGLAAHRDTFFRPLRKIATGDRITLRTPTGADEYAVESTRIVRPTETTVLANSKQSELTLVTCYPFHYVGSAPLRFIVRARRINDRVE